MLTFILIIYWVRFFEYVLVNAALILLESPTTNSKGRLEVNGSSRKIELERSHEALGAVWGRKVCSFETAKWERYTVNDREEAAKKTESSVELIWVYYYCLFHVPVVEACPRSITCAVF